MEPPPEVQGNRLGYCAGFSRALWRVLRHLEVVGLLPARRAREGRGSRWDLLDRACTCEGNLESILVRLASERPLESDDIEVLGCFRQLYQKLRQCIRD